MFEFLDRRYALALYEIAKEQGKEKEFIDDLKEISDIVLNSKEITDILNNPKIRNAQKKEVFDDLFKGKTFEDILAFIYVLIDKGRILELHGIADQIRLIYLQDHNTVEAVVKSIVPLKENEFKKLHEKLEMKFNKTVLLENVVDKSILGGLYVRVGDEVIDGSLLKKFNDIKTLMIHSREEK